MKNETLKTVSIQEMVEQVNLSGITFYEVSSRLREEETLVDDSGEDDSTEVSLDASWDVRIRHVGPQLGVRLRLHVQDASVDIVVDVAAEYESGETLAIEKPTVQEFVNNVALMQLYPFIREAVMTMSAKVSGQSLLLPVFQRGEITMELGDGPEISRGDL
ncbi:hypothetical protein [Homoserinimonas sp. A520]